MGNSGKGRRDPRNKGGAAVSIMSEMEGKFAEMFGQPFQVIDVYTRAQAIEDGIALN